MAVEGVAAEASTDRRGNKLSRNNRNRDSLKRETSERVVFAIFVQKKEKFKKKSRKKRKMKKKVAEIWAERRRKINDRGLQKKRHTRVSTSSQNVLFFQKIQAIFCELTGGPKRLEI